MRRAALMALLLSGPTAAHRADRVIGLLSMPEVFWEEHGPCDETFTSRNVLLHSAPQSSEVIGDIRVDRDPNAEITCTVNVHLRDGAVSELPTEEYAYEQRAAIVLDRRERWFKVRLADGSGWLRASSLDRFFPLEDLLWEHRELLGATESWDRRIASEPGGDLRPLPNDPRRHLIGYLTPVLTDLRVVVRAGEDPEKIARSYPNNGWGGGVRQPDGTTTLYIQTPTEVEAFERPEAEAPVVIRFRNDAPVLIGTDANPPGHFVFDRRPGWFQVRRRLEVYESKTWRSEPILWVRESPAWKFTAVTSEAERQEVADGVWGPEYDDMRVKRLQRVGGELWAEVELLNHSYCEGTEDPTVLVRGWMPVHHTSGEPHIRFYSRGC